MPMRTLNKIEIVVFTLKYMYLRFCTFEFVVHKPNNL